jgi:hypothetical protein
MNDMSETTYIFGVKIIRDRSKKILALSQKHYTRKILENFYIQDCKHIDTLIEKDEDLNLRICPKTPYEKNINGYQFRY